MKPLALTSATLLLLLTGCGNTGGSDSRVAERPQHNFQTINAVIDLPGMPLVPDDWSATDRLAALQEQLVAMSSGEELDCSEGTDEFPTDFTPGARVDVLQDGVAVDTTYLDHGTWSKDTNCRFPISVRVDINGPTPNFTLPNGMRLAFNEYLGESMPSVSRDEGVAPTDDATAAP